MKIEELIHEQQVKLCRKKRILRGNPTFIPISLSGGIGDVIIARSTLRFLAERYDVLCFSPHVEALEYFGISVQKGPMPFFVWHLELNTVARFNFSDQFCEFLIGEHTELFKQQQALFEKEPFVEQFVKDHPHQDAALARFANAKGLNRESFALYSLGFENVHHGS